MKMGLVIEILAVTLSLFILVGLHVSVRETVRTHICEKYSHM